MKRSTNTLEIKKHNRNRVFRFVNSRNETCVSEVSLALNISSPTVMTSIKELKEAGIVEEVGEYESTGGRKAKAIASIKDAKYALGLDITQNHVGIVYTDLRQKVLRYERIQKPFCNTESYLLELAEILKKFVAENHIPEERIVGVGIAVPAIIDRKKNMLTHSRALEVFSVPCKEWTEKMPYPCELLNDANAGAFCESVESENQESMVYLSLSNTVGGAVVFHSDERNEYPGKMYEGNNWRSGEFGHMVIHPGGERCYCGKQGCLDAYCSAKKLADLENGKLELFFEKLESGDKEYQKIWKTYLEDLAIAVDNLRMCFDCEVVLGGYVGYYMAPYIREFRNMVAEKNIFEDDGSYVRTCRYQKASLALGAAVYQIEKYIDSI